MKNWIQLGHSQHLCVADKCRFRLGTLLPNGYVISTVGKYYPTKDDIKMEEVGYNRFYETFVFRQEDNKFMDCGCPVINYTEIDVVGYKTGKEAQEGHRKMCKKYEKKLHVKTSL